MLASALTVITSVLGAIGDFLTPESAEGSLITSAGVAAIATLFAIPIGVKAIRKAIGLVKSV